MDLNLPPYDKVVNSIKINESLDSPDMENPNQNPKLKCLHYKDMSNNVNYTTNPMDTDNLPPYDMLNLK